MAGAGAGAEAARLEDALAKSEAGRASAEAALARASATQDSDLAAAREAAADLRVSPRLSLANYLPKCAQEGRLIHVKIFRWQCCCSVLAQHPHWTMRTCIALHVSSTCLLQHHCIVGSYQMGSCTPQSHRVMLYRDVQRGCCTLQPNTSCHALLKRLAFAYQWP